MDFNKEQIFIVTGASSGLGEATAIMLNKLGATVIGIGRNLSRLETMKSKCLNPDNMFLEQKDLADDIENLPKYVKELKEKYGKFSGMAYCAGVAGIVPIHAQDYNNLINIFNANYFCPVLMTKGLVNKRNNIGTRTSIVVISSIAAISNDKGHLAYSGSKSALCSSMKSIAREVANTGIRINTILPSCIKTPMTMLDEEYLNTQKEFYPFGIGEPDDVANMIVYLLSDKAKFISGQNYVIDSGGVL